MTSKYTEERNKAKLNAVELMAEANRVKSEMIATPSDYVKSKLPIACNRNSEPSVVAELGQYIGSEEGMELLRRGIRALMVQFAHGDKSAQTILLKTAPNITQIDIRGLMGHIVEHNHKGAMSPAELRRVERDAMGVYDAEVTEVRKEPIEVIHQ